MNVKALPLLLCVFLLCGCSKEMPEGETCLPVSETQAFTEVVEEPTIPENWEIPRSGSAMFTSQSQTAKARLLPISLRSL